MMFFVYQIVTKPLTSKILTDEICPSCEKIGELELTLYMRYIAMGIPLFGMGRHTGVVCTNCGNVLKNPYSSVFAKKKYSGTVASAIKDIRANHKRTLWQLLYPWSIWFVIPVFVFFLFVYGSIIKENTKDRAKKYAELINHPQTGDIYKATWSENSLSEGVLVKVTRINGDTLHIVKTKKAIPFSYAEVEWKKLSTESDAFDSKEYKIMNFAKLKEANYGDFFMYSEDKNSNLPIYLGEILNNKSEMDLGFETIERKSK